MKSKRLRLHHKEAIIFDSIMLCPEYNKKKHLLS